MNVPGCLEHVPINFLVLRCCCLCWKNRAFVKATWMWLGAISFCTSLGGWVVGSHGGSKTTAIREAFLRKACIIDWIYPSTSISSGQWRLCLGFPSLNMFHWWWLATCVGGRSNINDNGHIMPYGDWSKNKVMMIIIDNAWFVRYTQKEHVI